MGVMNDVAWSTGANSWPLSALDTIQLWDATPRGRLPQQSWFQAAGIEHRGLESRRPVAGFRV